LAPLDKLVLLKFAEQTGIGAGEILHLFGRELPLVVAGQQVGFAQALATGGSDCASVTLELPANDFERQILIALHGQHPYQTTVVVL
jgi:hypothetical protein